LANIALSVSMEDAAMTNLLEGERGKLALLGRADSPLVQNTINGDQPSLDILGAAAINAGAARLIAGLNRFHRMLMMKYTLTYVAYTGKPLYCGQPVCPEPDCECPCDCQIDPEPDCPCGEPKDDGCSPCDDIKEDEPCLCPEQPCQRA
jgi:hypothetical protein